MRALVAASFVLLLITVACGSEASQPIAVKEPAVGDWVQSDNADGLSISLWAYETHETGEGEGDARLTVTCFNSPPVGHTLAPILLGVPTYLYSMT